MEQSAEPPLCERGPTDAEKMAPWDSWDITIGRNGAGSCWVMLCDPYEIGNVRPPLARGFQMDLSFLCVNRVALGS